MAGIVGAPSHPFKNDRIVNLRIDTGLFKTLRHDFRAESLHSIIEQHFLDDALPSFTHLRIEPDNVPPESPIGVIVASTGEHIEFLSDFVEALINAFHLPWPSGFIDQAEPAFARAVARTPHPFAMQADASPEGLRRNHVMKQDVMGEHDDLTAFGGLFREARRHSLNAVMIERGYRVVDNDGVFAADLVQFRKEASQRESALFTLAQNVAVVADALPGIERYLDNALSALTTIRQIQREVSKLQPFELFA